MDIHLAHAQIVKKEFDPSFYDAQMPLPAQLENAVTKRKAEFLAGRECAHLALEQLGIKGSVEVGDNRRPKWPQGIVGSISHSQGVAIAVTALADAYQSIGIDVQEIIQEKSLEAICKQVLLPSEAHFAQSLVEASLVFSAKESIYKCINPMIDVFFGFDAVEIFSIADGSFSARFVKDIHPQFKTGMVISGKYQITLKEVYTLVALSF